jgi:acetyl/propionyl-CoA carboxylase alpha subunit
LEPEVKKIKRLAIANRGEVAIRIIHACDELGIESVLLHSEADVETRAYRMATKKICIGAGAASESYLNILANVQGALSAGADAVHPGFGFLSENSEFVTACEAAGLIFVGPSAAAMKALGDKVSCKALAKKLNLPLVPGYEGENQSLDFLITQAEKIGFPVIVKAAAGGGGRGMKILRSKAECGDQIESAQREAESAFGSNKVFLEKYLDHAKHIEFQIFADASGKVVHLMDRECSVQRRHQKIIEEALSPSLSVDQRRRMGECAVQITEAAKYRGAGTVEFLLQDDQFYLLEVNTRLQVEHPVTEMVMGVDLVKAQILTAQGSSVFPESQMLIPRGHAIECRIYAENPFLGGIPSTGRLGKVFWPEGPGRRFEYGFEEGDEITPLYDSMIAKVIVWDENRSRAIEKMVYVLKQSIVFGVHTNIPFLIKMLEHPEFVSGKMTTRFVETHFSEPLVADPLTADEVDFTEHALRSHAPEAGSVTTQSPWQSFWRVET